MRPIFGSINLAVATTMSIYGSLSLAFDSGKALKDGTMGILMSLPELAFFNIRKGSYKHLSLPEN
ncbi:secreted protein [methanotrophic bacterial endosymbiont of Bathymodiolus sp.]|nr:secreted protein [methanotrophic bacterial endosymbiont of Bathymodiolus sp.]